jgi:hypothetical protein
MPGRGRPTILNEQIADQLVVMLRAGNFVHVACRAAGVSRQAYQVWMRRGLSSKAADAPFRELRGRIEQALDEAEVRAVTQIAKASGEDWRAAAWYLERAHPERWSRDRTAGRPDEVLTAPADTDTDPFAEVDQLAEQRRKHRAS